MENEDIKNLINEITKDSETLNLMDIYLKKNIQSYINPNLEVANEMFYLFEKYNLNWAERFMLSASMSTTLISGFMDRLKENNLKSDEKDKLLTLYKNIQDNYHNNALYLTVLNTIGDSLLGRVSKGNQSNPLPTTSINLKKRFNILKKYGFKCVYCGRQAPEVRLELEHIIPKSKGGSDDESNLVPACFECNRGKSDEMLGGGLQ